MTLRHMKIFLEVARQGSMSKAAKTLYLAQPTVSQVIFEIEREYNVQLFERISQRIHITRTGQQLAERARQIMDLHMDMERMLRSGESSTIRLGASLTVATSVFSTLLTDYKNEKPSIETHVVVRNTSELEVLLLTGKLDFALVEGKISSPYILSTPVLEDNMVLVVGRGHRFFGREKLSLNELNGEAFVLREEGSGTRDFFMNRMNEAQVHIECAWVCHSPEAIKHAVVAGHGLTVISKRLVLQEIEQGALWACSVENYDEKRTFDLVYRKDKYLFPHFRDFIKLCQNLKTKGSGITV